MIRKRFRVALSFPGEHRTFVAQVARSLARQLGKERVFYDRYFEAELARSDLDTYLQRLYHDEAELGSSTVNRLSLPKMSQLLCKTYAFDQHAQCLHPSPARCPAREAISLTIEVAS